MIGENLRADSDREVISRNQFKRGLITQVRINLKQLRRNLGSWKPPLREVLPGLMVSKTPKENLG